MSLSSGMLSWGNKFGWTIGWSTPDTSIISLIWASTNQAFQLLVEGGKPVFFVVNLNTGTISGSFYKSAMTQTSITAADLVYTGSSTTIYILVRYSGGFHKFEYYPSSSTFSVGMQNTAVTGYFAAVMNGFTYFGGQLISNSNAFITKIVGNGSIIQQQTFVLSSTSDTFVVNTSSGYGLSNDTTIIVTAGINPIISLGTLIFALPGSYTQSSTGIFKSDIVYRNGFQESLYVQENYSGKVEFQYPCSISGSTSVSSTLIAHPTTGTYPSWISLNSDYENINVVAPAYGGSNVYYFGVKSVIYGEIIDKFVTINIYKCLVLNCLSWSYTATGNWNKWLSGYNLSIDKIQWIIQTNTNSQINKSTNDTQTLSNESTISSLSYFSGGVILTSTAAWFIGSSFGYSSPQGIWTFFNQYQLVLVLPFLRTNLSRNFFVLVKYLKFVTFNFSFLDDISFLNIPYIKDPFDYEQKDKVYYDNGLKSGSFIVNRFGLIKAILSTIFCHIFWLIAFKFIRWSYQIITSFKQKILSTFHLNNYIKLIFVSFLFNFIAAFIEALRIDDALNSSIPISSYLIGLVSTLLLIAFAIFIVLYYWWKRERIWESKYFSELFEPFKKTHLAKQYYAVFIIRRLVIVLIVVLCKDLSNNYKLFIYVFLQFVAFGYATFVMPFVSKLNCVVEITNEVFYLTICIMVIIYHITSSYTDILSYVILALVVLNGVIISIEINSVSVYNLIKQWSNWKKKIASVDENKDEYKPKVAESDFIDTEKQEKVSRELGSKTFTPTAHNYPGNLFCPIRIESIASNHDINFSKVDVESSDSWEDT